MGGCPRTAHTAVVVACRYSEASSSANRPVLGASWAMSSHFFSPRLRKGGDGRLRARGVPVGWPLIAEATACKQPMRGALTVIADLIPPLHGTLQGVYCPVPAAGTGRGTAHHPCWRIRLQAPTQGLELPRRQLGAIAALTLITQPGHASCTVRAAPCQKTGPAPSRNIPHLLHGIA